MLIINRYHTSLKRKAERHKSWATLNLLYSWINGKAFIAHLLVPMKYHNPWLKWNLFLVRLTRVINGSIEEPWYRLLYVTWKKIPLSTPPSSVVNIELWITQWQPCRDSGGWAKPATQSPQPGMQKIAHTPSQSRAEPNLFHMVPEKESQGSSEATVYISTCVWSSQIHPPPFYTHPFCFSLSPIIRSCD